MALTEQRGGWFIKYEMNLADIGLETVAYKALGKASLSKNQRLSDLLNDDKKFVVLRDAKVLPLKDKGHSYEKEYLMVNKNSIVFAWEE